MARHPRSDELDSAPARPPDPKSYPGYAEEVPRNKEQAQKPGPKQPPGSEDGDLEHEPDPKT